MQDIIPEEEVLAFLRKRVGLLDAVCITGGEPTLQKDLKQFIIKVKDMGYAVKLDTNGTNPALLDELLSEGLIDYVAMDIKNSPEKYSLTAGADVDLNNILKSIELIKSKAPDCEFRTTVTKELHTGDDIRRIALTVGKGNKYFIQQFKDSGSLISGGHSPWDVNDLHSIKERLLSLCFNASIRES